MSINLHSKIADNALILSLTGRLDSLTSSSIETELLNHIEQTSLPILINLQSLDYIASAGLRIILMAAKRAKSQEKNLTLCGLQPQIYHVFEISGFLKIMDIYSDQAQALQNLKN